MELKDNFTREDLYVFMKTLEDLSEETKEKIYFKLLQEALKNELNIIANLIESFLREYNNNFIYSRHNINNIIDSIDAIVKQNKLEGTDYVIENTYPAYDALNQSLIIRQYSYDGPYRFSNNITININLNLSL